MLSLSRGVGDYKQYVTVCLSLIRGGGARK